MKRIVAAILLLACGSAAVWADSDAIAQRRDLMKANGKAVKPLVDMLKGAPFDLTVVQTSLKTFMNAAEKMPKLFPDDSKTGGETHALPAIWENKADFEARFAKLGTDSSTALKNIKDEASFKADIKPVLDNCGACHEHYKAKQE
jgi:cytochrome c556